MNHSQPSFPEGMRRGVRAPRWSARLVRLSVAAALLLTSVALAQPAGLPAFELERLELNPDGQGSLVVGTGLLLPQGAWRVSLAGHYENTPLGLYSEGTRLGSVVKDRVMAHVLAAWAPLRWLEVGVQLPLIAYQHGDDLSARGVGALASAGLSTPTVQARVGLLSQERAAPVDLGLELAVGLPLGSAATLSNDGAVRFTPRVMVGRSLGALRAGLEAGALIRPTTVLGDGAPVRNELGSEVRLGAVLATQGKGLRGELNVLGRVPLSRESASMEILAGLRLPLGQLFEVYALGGPGVGSAPGTPAFRVLLGVAGVGGRDPALLDDDGDGVLNGQDACPKVAGPADHKGCPVKDTDHDGIEDEQDKCPKEAGPAERQGCPVKDTDHDGIEDEQDRCPTEAGPAERQGCPIPDADHDGIEDSKDKCPKEAGPAERQGCPIPDADHDGIEDKKDRCPKEAGIPELRGCPAKDTDGDGIPDHLDNCPKEKGEADNQGCPAKQKQVVVIQKNKLDIKEQVFFDSGKTLIQARSFRMLDQMAKILNEHTEVEQMSIEGHTDDRGDAESNRTLSQQRAEAVKSYLVSKGVEASRLETHGFGPDRPIESNKTDKGRAANRRVEFLIVTPEREQK